MNMGVNSWCPKNLKLVILAYISIVIRLSNSVFNSFVNPVITTEEELVNITLSFDD